MSPKDVAVQRSKQQLSECPPVRAVGQPRECPKPGNWNGRLGWHPSVGVVVANELVSSVWFVVCLMLARCLVLLLARRPATSDRQCEVLS